MKRNFRLPPTALLAFIFIGLHCATAQAQIKQADSGSVVRYGATQVSRFQVGVTVNAKRSDAYNILAIVAVPLACAEQQVELVEEDLTPQVADLAYRPLGDGARQVMVRIPHLAQGDKAHALLTFDVSTRIVLPPEETDELTIPKKPDRKLKRYLGKSPFIQTKNSKFRRICSKLMKDLESSADDPASITDWQRIEAIYDYVQDKIEYLEGPDKSALETLKDGNGDCHDISALFVALCRTNKVPARMVWVNEHSYPEFCLEDKEGNQVWFPCESAGTPAFGEMPLPRVILQKGDSFKMPERPHKALRYASDFATAEGRPGLVKPSIKFVRRAL